MTAAPSDPAAATAPAVDVVTATPADWRALRAARLAMLADTPAAYGERLADAAALGDEAWRARAAGPSRRTRLVALGPDGSWVGRADLEPDPARAGVAWLLAVWVAPASRGRAAGVADALVDAALQAARRLGAATLLLEVADRTPRAAAFYRRRGFAATGRTRPAELDPSDTERELALAVTGPRPGDPVAVVSTHADGSPHRTRTATLLATDAAGTRLHQPPQRLATSAGGSFAAAATDLLVPAAGWWVASTCGPDATFSAPPGRWVDRYVDVTTPPRWSADGATVSWVDLDLDVRRLDDGSVELLDAGEFAERAARWSYPAHRVAAARAAAAEVADALRTRRPPFG